MEAKTIDIPSLTGPLDTRSLAPHVKLGEWRHILNAWVNAENSLCRVPGWDKLLTRANYNNQDLHDQLLTLTEKASRQPITFLFEATSQRKNTMLLAGTGEVIYALNNGTGNWKVISDQVGTTSDRWKAAQVFDTVVFTNGKDPLIYWQFDQGITDTGDQSVAQIPDLQNTLKITKAGVVVAWKDHLILMNVVVNGTVKSNGIYWSNYQRPLDLVPSDISTAGAFELDSGETILGAMELGSRLIIYTDKNIWEASATGNEVVFVFAKRYTPKQSECCLFYPRTLISIGNQHVYAGVDGIYYYNLFQDKPQRIEWIHRASGRMFSDINRADCEAHVAGYNSERKELMFSYATGDSAVPTETFVLKPDFKFAYYLDRGLSAMVNYVLKEPGQILRDFLLEQCICSEEDFVTYWGGFAKEGGYCTTPPDLTVDCEEGIPASIYTVNPKELEEGLETEDYDQVGATEDSLCAQLAFIGQTTLNQLCEAESRVDECRSGLRFVVADSIDYCLKELSENYYRETTVGFSGCGSYSRRGYRTLLRSGPINAGLTKADKEWTRFQIEMDPALQSTPSQVKLRIGNHSQALDPNNDSCGIVWEDQELKDMECQTDFNAVQHAANNTRPDGTFEWPLYNEGRNLYFEIEILNNKSSPVDTGGSCCFSRIAIDMKSNVRSYV